jgi:hypothetical protein
MQESGEKKQERRKIPTNARGRSNRNEGEEGEAEEKGRTAHSIKVNFLDPDLRVAENRECPCCHGKTALMISTGLLRVTSTARKVRAANFASGSIFN